MVKGVNFFFFRSIALHDIFGFLFIGAKSMRFKIKLVKGFHSKSKNNFTFLKRTFFIFYLFEVIGEYYLK